MGWVKRENPKVKASAATRFGRAERRSLSNTGRRQAGLKPRQDKKNGK